jgi:hypothetical protein
MDHDTRTTFRGIPIDLSMHRHVKEQGVLLNGHQPVKQDFVDQATSARETRHFHSPVVSHGSIHNENAAHTPKTGLNRRKLQFSLVLIIYDDDDYLVKHRMLIVAFIQESIQSGVDLQSIVAMSEPDASFIPKLLKSHDIIAYKDGDNATTWFQRFNNFCMMISIYIPPPKVMEKNSQMGREWDNQMLPNVFYHQYSHMLLEKVLTHMLFLPDFFLKSLQDNLQLNPKLYSFIRLFIQRPGAMKVSLSLFAVCVGMGELFLR